MDRFLQHLNSRWEEIRQEIAANYDFTDWESCKAYYYARGQLGMIEEIWDEYNRFLAKMEGKDDKDNRLIL